jgi:hypothetical protein
MRSAKTLAISLTVMSPLLARAGETHQPLPERDLGRIVAKATESRLAPETRNFLWFRLSLGHYKPSRAEFVASLSYANPHHAPGQVKIEATLVEAIEPIATQIASYFETNPTAPIEAATRALRIDRREYHEDACPAVREIQERFLLVVPAAIRKPGEPQGFYHGEHLEIEGYSDNAFFSIIVEEDNPLFKWGKEAASALERCRPK